MIRGTTPTLEFALPFEVDLIAEAYVTISQNQSVVIDKSLSELTCAGKQSMLLMAQIIINQLLTDHQQQRILRLVFLTEN